MAIKCMGCNKAAVKSEKYWLICKDNFKVRNLLGAATVGLCSDCIIKYTRSSFKKPILRACLWTLAAIAIIAYFFIGDYLHSSSMQTYLLFALMLAVAVFMVIRILVTLLTYIKKLKSGEFIRGLGEEDFEYAAVKLLSYGKPIEKNIIFNCKNLVEKAEKIAEDGMSDKTREFIKRPISFPKFKEFGVEKFHKDYVNIPRVGRPDIDNNEKLKKAIKIAAAEYYDNEIKI